MHGTNVKISDECVGIKRFLRIISHVRIITFFILSNYNSIVTIRTNRCTKFD